MNEPEDCVPPVKLRRPNYRLIEQCCENCKYCIADYEGEFICGRLETRQLTQEIWLENFIYPSGVCDAWEKKDEDTRLSSE
jgi:hypothetical protein